MGLELDIPQQRLFLVLNPFQSGHISHQSACYRCPHEYTIQLIFTTIY